MFNSTVKCTRRFGVSSLLLVYLFFYSACTTVKNYPPRTPFVYETTIRLNGNLTETEKKDLTDRLEQQLDDSLRVRRLQKLLVVNVINKPPHWDSIYADRSRVFMSGALNAQGYLRDSINYEKRIDTIQDQYRTFVNFNVFTGPQITIDSIRIQLTNDSVANKSLYDTLQRITEDNLKESLLKKGVPFSRDLISSEFDRLTDVYRNHGYLRFTRDDLVGVWDTLGIALLRPTLDPIEQAQQLEALHQRRQNPRADLEVRLRTDLDPLHLTRYHVGNVTVYPDSSPEAEAFNRPDTTYLDGYTIISYEHMFRPRVVAENIYLKRGDLYDQRNYLRTSNRFNSIGSWRLVTIDQIPRPGTDSVDFVLHLSPATKYLFNASLEGSKNWGNYFAEGNLLGLGVTTGLQNRNFMRGANIANTNLRYAVELNIGDQLIQTQQFSAGQTISIPRAVPKFGFLQKPGIENLRTNLSLNVGNTDRKDFFNLTSLNGSWSWEFNKGRNLWGFRPLNIEYSFLSRKSELEKLILANQSYKYIFNAGLIQSFIANFTHYGGTSSYTSQVRAGGELAGFPISISKATNIYRFAKIDLEGKIAFKIRRTELVLRGFLGVGYSIPRDNSDTQNFYLPFFREYYAGGANSMRAWALRKLGPGSTVVSFANDKAPDRFGDIQFETNIEYRFYLATIAGIKLNSALFTDIGNVWNLRTNPDYPNGEFRLNKFFTDLAIGVGTGLRVDLGIFVLRLDYAYKLKNPSPDITDANAQNKWAYDWRLLGGQLQLGINYPF